MRNKNLDFKLGTKFEDWTIISPAKNKVRVDGSGKLGELYYDIECKCGTVRKATTFEINSVIKYGFHADLSKTCRTCATKERRENRTLDQNLMSVYHDYKSNAKVRGKEFDLDKESAFNLMKQPCYYCGLEPSNKITKRFHTFEYSGIDRIDNTLGYSTANCVSCCSMCNIAKNNNSLEEFTS